MLKHPNPTFYITTLYIAVDTFTRKSYVPSQHSRFNMCMQDGILWIGIDKIKEVWNLKITLVQNGLH